MSETTEPKRGDNGLVETIKVVVQALLLALFIRTFLYQPFNIPSGSMKSTLLIGDYLFVSKFSYGWSKYSLPYAAIPFSGRILGSEPKRGDVAVFKLPRDNETDYIKRVIGLPGDRIQVKRGLLHINGAAVTVEPLEPFAERGRFGQTKRLAAFKETLPNGVTHTILRETDEGYQNNTPEFVVPAGHYFMMGDNRDNSQDSRWLDMVGYVPAENLIGEAKVIFFSIEEGATPWAFWTWPWEIRWSRLANLI